MTEPQFTIKPQQKSLNWTSLQPHKLRENKRASLGYHIKTNEPNLAIVATPQTKRE